MSSLKTLLIQAQKRFRTFVNVSDTYLLIKRTRFSVSPEEADLIEEALRRDGLPVHRGRLVSLDCSPAS